MIQTKCPDCGAIVGADRNICPECGCPIIHEATPPSEPATPTTKERQPVSPNTDSPIQPTPMPIPFFQADWAQYFYECGVIGWEICLLHWTRFSKGVLVIQPHLLACGWFHWRLGGFYSASANDRGRYSPNA